MSALLYTRLCNIAIEKRTQIIGISYFICIYLEKKVTNGGFNSLSLIIIMLKRHSCTKMVSSVLFCQTIAGRTQLLDQAS